MKCETAHPNVNEYERAQNLFRRPYTEHVSMNMPKFPYKYIILNNISF